MNQDIAIRAFQEYTGRYDAGNVNVSLKINHTYRVAGIAGRIGRDVGADPGFSWFLGLLHDIGRFEQLRQHGTFKDAQSVDHAELGADILFSEGLIDRFSHPDIPEWEKIAEQAIRLHNKLMVPEGLDPTELMYTHILRDADKVDIFRVLTEPPYDERNERILYASESLDTAQIAGEEVMQCVREHRCVPRTSEKTEFENLISQCCMGFELYYPISRRITREQGFLDRLMNLPLRNETMCGQLEILREEMKLAWETPA